jgi:hypothetical protein
VPFIDLALLDFTERCCRRFQVLTGRTNIWLAVQLTNLSIIVYFGAAIAYFLASDFATRVFIGVFCGGVLYALTQTLFRDSIEAYEVHAYRRVANGYRNPRRVRDALLRISFLFLCLVLWYPIIFIYRYQPVRLLPLTYSLIVLTTAVLYLLACDPLPPCPGKVREWLRGLSSRPEGALAEEKSRMTP